jgi:hypothetical protein
MPPTDPPAARVRVYRHLYDGPLPPGAEDHGDHFLTDSETATRLIDEAVMARRRRCLQYAVELPCCTPPRICPPPPRLAPPRLDL